LDRLLDIMKAARAAGTLEELETLRVEVDQVFDRTMREVERNRLDEPTLLALSLALDRVHLAISDRRTVLALHDVHMQSGSASSPADVTPLRMARAKTMADSPRS
jgi:hypothetical protein